jgi:tetratricopeptide (TPR) repeat protein
LAVITSERGWGRVLYKRIITFSAACVLSAATAFADGYRDFNAAITASDFDSPKVAIDQLSQVIASQDLPAHLRPTAYLVRGEKYASSGSLDLAIADYTAAIQLRSDWPELYIRRCDAYAAKKMLAEAAADCDHAISLQPNNGLLRMDRDDIYARNGKADDAIADYTKMISERPKLIDLYLSRGSAYYEKKDYDNAIADTDYFRSHVYGPAGSTQEGLIYFAKGDFAEALHYYDLALTSSPKDVWLNLSEGQALVALGRYKEAAEVLKNDLNPDDEENAAGTQPYAYLWYSIAQSKIGAQVPSDIAARFTAAGLPEWPGLILSLYEGKTDPDKVLAMKGTSAEGDDIPCNANIFAGEWYAIHGNAAKGRELLLTASKTCSVDSPLARIASAELGRMQ